MFSVRVNIGGCVVNLYGNKPIAIEENFRKFISQRTPDISLSLRSGSLPDFHLEEEVFQTDTYTLYRKGPELIFCFYRFPRRTPRKILILNLEGHQGELYFQEGDEPVLTYPVDQLLILTLLSLKEGFLLHSLGIVHQGKGVIFVGRSGSGKTTLAKILQSQGTGKILNDDRVILRKGGKNFYLYGTPWTGELEKCLPEKVKIGSIFFLKRDKSNSLRPVIKMLSKSEGLARITSCAFLPFWSRTGVEQSLQLFSELVSSLPLFEFSFNPAGKVFLPEMR